MTHEALRRALLAERYGDVVQAARELVDCHAWTPAEQARHRAELGFPDHNWELVQAIVDNLPPVGARRVVTVTASRSEVGTP